MVYDLFYVLLDSVCQHFVEIFCIYIHQRYWPAIFFFGSVFVWFWYQGVGGFIECLWECSLLFNLLEEFEYVVTRACTRCRAGPPLCSVVVTALLGAGSAP